MKKTIKHLAFTCWKLLTINKKETYLFLIAHPRSGSSLFMHILTSNKEICGFGEYLSAYKNSCDLQKAAFDIRRKTNTLFKRKKYVANQVNHLSVTPSEILLKTNNVKIIFLIRKPKETLSSLAVLAKKKNSGMSHTELAQIYKNRLKEIQVLAKQIPNTNWIYVTYIDLVEHSKEILKKTTQFLNLKQSLSSQYAIQKYTQVWGDPSKNIKAGEIIKTQSPQIIFSETILQSCEKIYLETVKVLQNNCLKD